MKIIGSKIENVEVEISLETLLSTVSKEIRKLYKLEEFDHIANYDELIHQNGSLRSVTILTGHIVNKKIYPGTYVDNKNWDYRDGGIPTPEQFQAIQTIYYLENLQTLMTINILKGNNEENIPN